MLHDVQYYTVQCLLMGVNTLPLPPLDAYDRELWKTVPQRSSMLSGHQVHVQPYCRLNMDLDLGSCVQLYSLPETQQPPPAFGLIYEGAIGQP